MVDALMAQLKAAGSEQARKTYRRHGAVDPMFGVPFSVMRPLARKLAGNTPLALELWKTGNYDAQWLASLVVNPADIKKTQLNQWLKGLQGYPLFDAVATVAAASPHGRSLMEQWLKSPHEWVSYAGWLTLARLADQIEEKTRLAYVKHIEKHVHTAKNRTRHGMNMALISVGVTGGAVTKAALAAAKRVGDVEVDHGDTACVTPNAHAYILKTLAHRKAKNTRKA